MLFYLKIDLARSPPPPNLSLSPSLSLSIYVFSHSLCLSLSLPLTLSLYVSLSQPLTVSLSLSFTISSLSPPLSVFPSIPPCLCLVFLSLLLSLYPSPSPPPPPPPIFLRYPGSTLGRNQHLLIKPLEKPIFSYNFPQDEPAWLWVRSLLTWSSISHPWHSRTPGAATQGYLT